MENLTYDDETRMLAVESATSELEAKLIAQSEELERAKTELEKIRTDRMDLAAEFVALKHNYTAKVSDLVGEQAKVEEMQLEIVNLLNKVQAMEKVQTCIITHTFNQ